MKKIIILLCFILFICISHASIKRTCHVQYKTEGSWSETYQMEVTFMTGQELNQATKSNDFNKGIYGILWFSNGGCAILKINISMVVYDNYNFSNQDFKNMYLSYTNHNAIQINSEIPITWNIKAKNSIGEFIDNRANQSSRTASYINIPD